MFMVKQDRPQESIISGWRSHIGLFAALGIYLVFQFILIRLVHIAQYDESIYLDVARNIRRIGLPLRSYGAEGFLLLDQTPLYPYLVAGLGFLVGENLMLFRLTTVLAGICSILLAYLIGQRARGPISGTVAAFLLAVNPFFILYSYFVRMELFMCLFLLLATHWLLHWEQTERLVYLKGAGVAVATAVLFKVVAVFYCATAVFYLFVHAPGWKQRLNRVLWMGVPTALGLILWLSMALLEPARLQLRLARWFGAIGGDSPIIDPRLGIAAWPWLQAVGGNVLGWATVALFFVALIRFMFDRQRKRIVWLLLLYISVVLGASLVMQLKEQRHVIGLIPMAAVAIALMIDWETSWTKIAGRTWTATVALITGFLFLWLLSPVNFPRANRTPAEWWTPALAYRLYSNDTSLQPLAEIGTFLKHETQPGEVIVIARQGPVVGYYANRPYLFLYTEPYDMNMALLATSTFVVLDSTDFWRHSPEETTQLLQYLENNFTVIKQTGGVAVYQRIQ